MAYAQKKRSEEDELWQALGAIARRHTNPLPTDSEAEISITRKLKKLDAAKRLVELQRVGRAPLNAEETAEKRELMAAMSDTALLDARPLPKVAPLVTYPMPRKPSVGRLAVFSQIKEAIGEIVARAEAPSSEPTEPVTIQRIVAENGALATTTGEAMGELSPAAQSLLADLANAGDENVYACDVERFRQYSAMPGWAEFACGKTIVVVS